MVLLLLLLLECGQQPKWQLASSQQKVLCCQGLQPRPSCLALLSQEPQPAAAAVAAVKHC
jgi:hypothetical protein